MSALLAVLVISVLTNILLASALAVARRVRYARMILIENKVACHVKSAEAAEQVRERILKEKRDSLPGEVQFKETWKDVQVRAEGEEILDVDQAVKKLSKGLHILVNCYAIRVRGKDIIYMPTEADADMVLEAVKAMYLKPGEEPIRQDFEERPLKSAFAVPPGQLQTDVKAAAKTVAQLVVVHTVKQRTEPDVAYQAKPEENSTPNLPRGERKVVESGAPGVMSVLVEIEMKNNRVVGTPRRLKSTIKTPAKPARVLVGSAPPAGH